MSVHDVLSPCGRARHRIAAIMHRDGHGFLSQGEAKTECTSQPSSANFRFVPSSRYSEVSRSLTLPRFLGKPPLPPLVLLHGIIFTCWLVHLLSQVTLVAAKRTDLHRRLGALGAVLAVLMIVVGIITAIYEAKHGFPPRSRPLVFLAVSICDILVFSILVAAGFYYRRQAETHKRLMLLATIAILDAAIGRLPRFHRGSDATSTNPPPQAGSGPDQQEG